MKRFLIITALIISFPAASYAQQTLSLTTFYPSPFGVYNQLRLVPQGIDPPCAGLDGLLWVNATGELKMCMGGLVSVPPGVWEQDSASPPNVYLTEDNLTTKNMKVGVGTISPARKLHVVDNVLQALRVDSGSASGVEMEFSEGVSLRGILGASSTETFYVKDSGGVTKHLVISSAGNVGIGLPVPIVPLHVVRPAVAPPLSVHAEGHIWSGRSDAAGGHLVAQGSGAGSPEGGQLSLFNAADWDATVDAWILDSNQDDFRITRSPFPAVTDMIIHQNGQVVFGGTGAAIGGNTVTVRGDLMVSNGATGTATAHLFVYVSDEDMKENIRPVKGLDTIMQLEGVEFDWKESQETGIGLVAQDVEKVLPELVVTDPSTNMKGVQYGNLVAPLIEAIKEQQAQIETLKKEIKELKANRF